MIIDKCFLDELNLYCLEHQRKYKSRQHVFLQRISLFLPRGYNKSYLVKHLKEFCCQLLEGLPVYAYLIHDNDIEKLNILISERYYLKQEKEFKVLEDHDVYKTKIEDSTGMIFCKKDDPLAVLCIRKGDLKYTFLSKFSYKNRIFAGNINTFENFVELMKNKWISLFKLILNYFHVRKSYLFLLFFLKYIMFYDRFPFLSQVNLTVLLIVLKTVPLEWYCFAVTLALAVAPLFDEVALLNFQVVE